MPLYEYLCSNCNTKFDLRRPISTKDDDAACPHCDSPHVSRQLSMVVALARGENGVREMGGAPACACGAGGCGCHS